MKQNKGNHEIGFYTISLILKLKKRKTKPIQGRNVYSFHLDKNINIVLTSDIQQ